MRLLHTADLHLSFQAYPRLTPSGLNQREVDVGRTFATLIDQAIALEPDVFVIAGDCFHSPRPSNRAIVHAFAQFSRLVKALPKCIVVAVSGNHDCGTGAHSGGILQLFTQLGVHVVDREARRLWFPERSLAVLAIPDSPGNVRPALTPDPAAKYNVALIHGEVQGMPRHGGTPTHEISNEELVAERWDYIAMGHYHVYREIAPNCFYSGSIDWTSSDIWGERREEIARSIPGKGFILRDLGTGAQTFHPILGVRPVFDLAPIDAEGLAPAEIDALMRSSFETCPDGAIVRLVINNIPRDVGHALDHKAIKQEGRRLLHLKVVENRPDPMERIREVTGERKKEIESLDARVRRKLMERELPPDVDREQFVAAGMAYFGEAAGGETSILEQQLSDSLAQPLERKSA